MSDTVRFAAEDEQIEEFDTDDDDSETETAPTKTAAPKSAVIKNIEPRRPLPVRSPLVNQYRPKKAEQKITINIKTPLITEPQKVAPKSPDKEVSDDKGVIEKPEKEPKSNESAVPKQSADTTATDYEKHLSYEGSLCIYTEPGTGRKLIWNTEQNAWVAKPDENNSQNKQMSDNSNEPVKSEGEIYEASRPEDDVNSETVGDEPVKNTTERTGPEAAMPGGIYGFEGDTHTYTDPNDGSVYMWDRDKNAWFPKVDDEFLARYQMSYGFTDSSAAEPNIPVPQVTVDPKTEKENRKAEAKRKAQEPSTWFEVDEAHNTAVYITGLPLDITMEELTGIVTKYGLLARDDKAKDKIKLYKDEDGQPKGDALVTYIKVESVNLALHLLDGSQIRGNTLSVQRAKFQMKGKYDPGLKPKRKKRDKERAKKIHEKLFDWRPEPMRGEPQKCERVVVIKNLFSPADFDQEVTLLLEYQQDLRAECSKCGDVKKVVLYDRHPEGVAQVTFKEPAEAQACIQLLNGRWFAQKKISAEIWDGKTKYKIVETEAEIEERIAKWDKFLDDEDDKKEAAKKKAAEDREAEQKTAV
ncbi:HIV Tat-specific factor 1 homolog [Neodiprion lecontei]|uniref:HIV Tat-specific factor 1 homolog n=1 Tax=Neodiprion lecontei TaxID=441921 RepID=A0A6J0BIN5_NEOLC|nr:HIV Tat-specific factor 1 homolog [Neodiprion lecontei]XP_046585929.1 HIV Tat-specific factor 1 homolog [Neodiprion lecontei]XP_046585930.1 HIV Tat-specific factor 1 homolog [Neodiprion lecontei]XP_046585931.1 HIV Tat-specific factor 1 homolog [Neodiprion lecontei]